MDYLLMTMPEGYPHMGRTVFTTLKSNSDSASTIYLFIYCGLIAQSTAQGHLRALASTRLLVQWSLFRSTHSGVRKSMVLFDPEADDDGEEC